MRKIHQTIATLALGLLISAAQSAKADVQITIGSETYGVTVVSDTFQNLMAQLEAQPEWNNQTLATTISTDVGTQFGLPNVSGELGPFFAYENNPAFVNAVEVTTLNTGSFSSFVVSQTTLFDFGILTDEGPTAVPDAPSFLTSLCLFVPALAFGIRKHLFQRRMA